MTHPTATCVTGSPDDLTSDLSPLTFPHPPFHTSHLSPQTSLLSDAISHYHDLLTDDIGAETQGQLEEQLRVRGLFFGERPLCTVVRPRFLSPVQFRHLQKRAALVLGAFGRALEAALGSEEVLAQFRLTDWERELLRDDPGFPESSPVSRLDAFFVSESGGLRFTEYNAETPAGGAYNDVLTEVFYGLPAMRQFIRRYDMRTLPARHNVLAAVLECYELWAAARGRGSKRPRIAIFDWSDVPTQSEFRLYQDYFRRQGLECVIADPREAEYANGVLSAGGAPVDLVYKRVLLTELVERCGMDGTLLRAVREGAACMVNPARCKPLHKKASLAVLSDERTAHLYTAEQREAIAAHIPWTRVVEERTTEVFEVRGERSEVRGPNDPSHLAPRTSDLMEFVAAHRDSLVLKPNDEYGGKGIVLGWEVDQTAWEEALRTALAEPYIVQQRIELPTELYPSVVDGRVVLAERMVDTAPYIAHGAYVDSCLSRLGGTKGLLNVTAGSGSQTPTFVVERR